MQKLAASFVPVAEEVHFLYPEGEWSLAQLAADPAHLLFKAFGEQVPKAEWNHPGTKQGIYMMGPNGEYLEGAHASSGHADRLVERLERALERWEALANDKSYAEKPIPASEVVAPPDVAKAPLALRVFLRDLPRGKKDDSGRRVQNADKRGKPWMGFTEWAWNQNWLTLDRPDALVTKSRKAVPVHPETAQRIIRQALVDNVRGQNPAWRPEEVLRAELTMRQLSSKRGVRTIEYVGSAEMKAEGGKRFAPEIYGRAEWSDKDAAFRTLRVVAIGERAGAALYNQRKADQEPSPMGVLLELVPRSSGKDDPDRTRGKD